MDFVGEIITGMLIGVANILPGVSGSALAVSMGVYDRILEAMSSLLSHTKSSLKALFPYMFGALLGALGLSFMMETLFERWPLQTNMTFIGLILGGLPAVAEMATGNLRKEKRLPRFLALVLALALALFMGLAQRKSGADASLAMSVWQVLVLFFLGIVGAFSMIVPGISGTMIFMMVGYYEPLLRIINRMVLGVAGGNGAEILYCGQRLLPLAVGLAAGMILCAKCLLWLFDRYRAISYSAVMGLAFSSPVVILAKMDWGTFSIMDILTGAALCAAAVWAVAVMGKEKDGER